MSAPIVIICGATASGKTQLAVRVAAALKSQIVSADSAQVYIGLDKGTAKPTSEELALAPHRMIDVAQPSATYTVGDYRAEARKTIEKLWENRQIPVVCGGTGFYIKSLLYDYSYGGVGANTDIRKKYEDYLRDNGKEALFALLRQKDEESAKVLHANDVVRVIRALEIFDATGAPKSMQHDEENPIRPYLAYCLDRDREELYDRINQRVDQMLLSGLVEEVKGLLCCGVSRQAQCMQAIGYKEVIGYLDGAYDYGAMSDIIKQRTRNYAKRQLTFFKKLKNLQYLDPKDGLENNVQAILRDVENQKWTISS